MNLEKNIIGFHHVSIKARDIQATINFYTHLGFLPVHDWSLPEFHLEQCVMLYNQNLNYYIEICDKDANFPTQGRKRNINDEYIENNLLHFCFIVKNADKAQKDAINLGAKKLSDGVESLVLENKTKKILITNSLVYGLNGEVIEFLEDVDFI